MRKREEAAKAAIMHVWWAAIRRRRMSTYPVLRRIVAVAFERGVDLGKPGSRPPPRAHRASPRPDASPDDLRRWTAGERGGRAPDRARRQRAHGDPHRARQRATRSLRAAHRAAPR